MESLLGKQETLTLEFKADHPNDPMFHEGELTNNGRKIVAKEISAFANSAGGVIVFGVDCRKVGGIDEAHSLVPIPNISRAEMSVRTVASELLQPRHSGIGVMSIEATAKPGAGYIILYVPRSERRPHRSEAKGQKEYFKRSGASAFSMEHYDIEDAFKRQSSPLLSMNFDFHWRMKSGERFEMQMLFGVANTGEVSGKFVTLQVWNQKERILKANRSHLLTSFSEFDDRMTFAAPSDFVIHPEQTRAFETLQFTINRGASGVLLLHGKPLEPGLITFDYSIGAEGMRSQHSQFVLDERHVESIRRITAD